MKLPLDLGTRAKVTTRTPAASERGGLLVPLISGLGGQRQHLWLLPATQDVLGMRKHEVGAKGADDRDACGQLDGRSSLNLPSTPDDTTSAAYVFASARAIWQGTNREREREHLHAPHRTCPPRRSVARLPAVGAVEVPSCAPIPAMAICPVICVTCAGAGGAGGGRGLVGAGAGTGAGGAAGGASGAAAGTCSDCRAP